MWEITFQERSSKNHVIHKVNFMVITKVERLMLPNILQSEQELHIGLMYMYGIGRKYLKAFAISHLTTRFNVVDSEHRVITTGDCIQFVVVQLFTQF